MKRLFPILLPAVLIVSFAHPPRSKCRAYGGASHYISHKDTLDFIGENRFEIAAHSKGRNERLTGICTVQDGVMELTFDTPKGEEIPHKTRYTFQSRRIRYIEEGSTGFYGYKGQRFRFVEE